MGGEIKKNGNGTTTVTLKRPVKLGDDLVTSLTLRDEATVADLEAMDRGKGEVGKTVFLIAELAGVPPALVRRLSTADYAIVAGVMSDALGNVPGGTGET